MKRGAILITILTLGLSVVSCEKKQEKIEFTSTFNEEIAEEDLSNFYQENLEMITKLFSDNSLKIKEEIDSTGKYEGIVGITSEDSSNKAILGIKSAEYSLHFDESNSADYIISSMTISIDEKDIKDNGFKIDSTEPYKLTTILTPTITNEAILEKHINDYYRGTGKNMEEIETNNVIQRITMSEGELNYTVLISITNSL